MMKMKKCGSEVGDTGLAEGMLSIRIGSPAEGIVRGDVLGSDVERCINVILFYDQMNLN